MHQQPILHHPHKSPAPENVDVDKLINKLVAAGIIMFLIIVILFGIYMLSAGV